MKNMRLQTIGGLGAEKHERTCGRFEVRSYETWHFDTLMDAFQYYNKLHYPASLYDTTEAPHVCLEIKVFSEFEVLKGKSN
jgi:hypothetical protein